MSTHGTSKDVVKTGYKYKDADTCGLYLSGHRIAASFDRVFDTFRADFDDDVTVDVVAGGCNSCTTPADDADVWAYYVAQGRHDTDSLYVGYGAADDAHADTEDVARALVVAAAEEGVPVAWDGSTGHKVCLGDAGAYDD